MDGKRLLAIVLALAFVVSCSGSASTTGASGAATAAATSASTGAPATGAPTTAAGGNQPKLADLVAASKVSQYKIAYKITASGAGADAFSGEQSWYFKPPRARFDFGSSIGGQTTTISFFSLPEGSFYCFAGGGSAQCLAIAGAGSPLDQNLPVSVQQSLVNHPDQYGGRISQSKNIPRQDAPCDYGEKPAAAAARRSV